MLWENKNKFGNQQDIECFGCEVDPQKSYVQIHKPHSRAKTPPRISRRWLKLYLEVVYADRKTRQYIQSQKSGGTNSLL